MSEPGSDRSSVPEPARPLRRRRRVVRTILISGFLLFWAIQLIPYGRAHTNPPVTVQIPWDSARTETLVRGACFDCHSNETHWPWYSHLAPVSWLVANDVMEGREELNFSVGNLDELHEAAELVHEGEMPPWFYRPLHAGARLSEAEKVELLGGLSATFGVRFEDEHGDDRHDD